MWFVWLILVAACYLGACNSDTTPADTMNLCQLDDQCPIGQYCDDGLCVPGSVACSEVAPCPSGQVCRNGTCVGESQDGGDAGDGGDGGGDAGAEPDIEIVEPLPSQGVYQINFGNVQVGQAVEQRVVVRNSGGAELRLLELNFESGTAFEDFSVPQDTLDALPIALQPGEEAEIPVVYLASDGTTDSSVLDVISNDPDEALVRIQLLSEFKGEARVAVDRQALDFGDVEVGQQSQPLTVTVSNQGTGNAVLTVSDIRLGIVANEDFSLVVRDSGGQAASLPALVNNGDFLEVAVTYHPQAHEDDADRLIIVSDDSLNPTVEVALSGRGVVGDITVTPSPVALGRVRVGTSSSQTVTITNSGGADLQLTGIALSGSGEWSLASTDIDLANLDSTPHPLASGAAATVELTFTAQDVGTESGELTITHTGPSAERRVSLSAEGYIPAHVTFDPDPPLLQYNDVQYDSPTGTAQTASLVVRVGNSGGEDLQVSGMSLEAGGAEFTWQPNLTVIPQGGQVDLQVSFTPSRAGAFANRLLIDTNDPDVAYDGVVGRAAVELQAQAVDPVMVVSPADPQDLGSVAIGSEARRTITIISASPDPLLVTDISLVGASSDFMLENLPDISQPLVGLGSSYSFDVVYRPSDAGSDNNQLTITSNDIGNPLVSIPLSASSNGCPSGFADCDPGVAGCETPLGTVSDCAGCGDTCQFANGVPACVQGSCELQGCEAGFVDLDGNPANGCECQVSGGLDLPGDGADSNCDGIDGDAAASIFVASDGSDGYPGTPEQPKATIQAGIAAAAADPAKLYVLVSQGSYGGRVDLVNGVSVFGGYDRANGWSFAPGNVVAVQVSSDTGSNRIGLRGSDISATTEVAYLSVTTTDTTTTAASNYGLHCQRCNGLYLHDVTLVAGRGGAGGDPGQDGQPGDDGSSGSAGSDGSGGSGGPGGSGGAGGDGGLANCSGEAGYGGRGGSGGAGGRGGHGGGGAGGPSYAVYTVNTSAQLASNSLAHGQGGPGGASLGNPGVAGVAADSN